MKKFTLLIIGFLLLVTTTAYAAETQQGKQDLPSSGFTIWPLNRNAIDIYQIIHEVKPGQEIEDYVMVKNSADTEKTFGLYPADQEIKNGKTVYKTSDDTQENIGKWISIETPNVTLGPNEEKKIKILITIPSDASFADYKGGIALENVQPSLDYPGINIASRVMLGVQIKVTDDPHEIPKFVQANIFTSATPTLWVSVGIFVASMAYFIYAKKREKNEKAKSSSGEK